MRKIWVMTHSRSWWLGMFNIALGTALAVTANVDGLQEINGIMVDMTGGGSPYMFITAGMALIGIRSAVEK